MIVTKKIEIDVSETLSALFTLSSRSKRTVFLRSLTVIEFDRLMREMNGYRAVLQYDELRYKHVMEAIHIVIGFVKRIPE